jgi:prepilin peptidase dependent protein B
VQNLGHTSSQRGFTLTELMIAIALGMSVISSVLLGYLATYSGSVSTLANSKLSQEMATLMNLMVEDIRRAGYSASVPDPTLNPFSNVASTALTVFTAAGGTQQAANATTGECILYSYDRDNDGTVDAEEMFGFRKNGAIVEIRTTGVVANAPTCGVGAQWTALTDSAFMTVTALNFSLASSQCINNREPDGIDNGGAGGIDDAAEINCYTNAPTAGSGNITTETRQVLITLTANLTGDTFVQMSMEQNVRVRNDMVRAR